MRRSGIGILQTEAVIILHHSVEMILRLLYAHVEYKDCPWQGMASEVNFATFKAKVDKSLTEGFDRAVIADIFLGGASPQDAAVAMSAQDFEDAIDGIDLLLQECCQASAVGVVPLQRDQARAQHNCAR